jgi:hypothetical protein
MLVIFVFLGVAALLGLGYYELAKWAKMPTKKERDSATNNYGDPPGVGKRGAGWVIFGVALFAFVLTSICTGKSVATLESKYDTFLAYKIEEPTDVLVIHYSDLAGVEDRTRLAPSVGEWIDIKQVVFSYNESLYNLRYLSKNFWLWPLIASPPDRLKPVVVK